MTLILLIRYIHIIAASLWLGEVAVINFVLIPTLGRYQGNARREFLNTIFPRIFRMASILSGTTAVSGAILFYYYHGIDIPYVIGTGSSGIALLVAGALGGILTAFHFFMENRMACKVGVGDPNLPEEKVNDIHTTLKIIPRIGMVVISTIFILMMYSVNS